MEKHQVDSINDGGKDSIEVKYQWVLLLVHTTYNGYKNIENYCDDVRKWKSISCLLGVVAAPHAVDNGTIE